MIKSAMTALSVGALSILPMQSCDPPDDGTPQVAGWYVSGWPQYVGQEFYGPSGFVEVDVVCWDGVNTVSLITKEGPATWKANGTLWVNNVCSYAGYPYVYSHYAYAWG